LTPPRIYSEFSARAVFQSIGARAFVAKAEESLVEHIVLFKLKADAPDEKKEELLQRLRSLKEKIPEILEFSCGANFSARSQGYTHGLASRFADQDALRTYQVHPDHVACVNESLLPIVEEGGILAFDYET
jgi:hypothetical protein